LTDGIGMASSVDQQLRARIEAGDALAAIVGLGYAGLPLAMALISCGVPVLGYDIDLVRVEKLQAGESYIADVPSAAIAQAIETGLLEVASSPDALKRADVIHICVPTPLSKTKEPELSFVLSATRTVAEHLRVGQLIILESTTYPGTTEELVRPLLESEGLRVGEDVFLAYSPERIDPGNGSYGITNTPKIVGGATPTCTALASAFYKRVVEDVVPVSSSQTAEMVKLLENTFRSVNIALANEISLVCDRLGVDVWEVVDAAATKPFGFMPFYPGPGLGGHCIPVDPHYLAWRARELEIHARLIQLATEINASMPQHVVHKVADALNAHERALRGSKILVLGVAYKPDVADVRESPALDVMTLLVREGAEVVYHDPYVDHVTCEGNRLESVPAWETLVDRVDAVVILTDHRKIDYSPLRGAQCAVVDTRGALRDQGAGHRT